MKRFPGILVAFFVILVLSSPTPAGEKTLLDQAAGEIRSVMEKTEDLPQKLSLRNAAAALEAAGEALAKGDGKEAAKNKKKALKWYVQAVRECMAPGAAGEKIIEALKEEGRMRENGVSRFRDLLKIMVSAKESKEKSDLPIYQGMALNCILLALFEVIDTGDIDGFEPEKALKWYLNAAASCEDVQKLIDDLLDYQAKHGDLSGIPDISAEGCRRAREMVERLYELKRKGAPPDEIVKLAEEIKKFLDEEGARTGRARRAKYEAEAEKEKKTAERVATRPTTTVRFTALDGETNINRDFVGNVETVRFIALDGKEVPPEEVRPDVTDHGDHHTISVGKAAEIASIVLTGTAGIVRLIQDGAGGTPAGFSGIAPKDGTIDVHNGVIEETFQVTPGTPGMAWSPADHAVTVAGEPVTVVAVRPDQVAVAGTGLAPSPAGSVPVTMTTPSGTVLSAACPSWGYNLFLPQAVKTRVPVPVTAEVIGLEPDRKVTFRFIPGPGQVIEPVTVTLPAAALVTPAPVATLRVVTPGPQGLDVVVTVEEK